MSDINIVMRLSGATEVVSGLNGVVSAVATVNARITSGISAAWKAVGVATAATTAAFTAGLHDIIDLGGKMHDLSLATGTAASKLLVLQQALRDNGASAESLDFHLARVQRTLIDAAENGGEAAKAFKSIGLNVGELLGLDPGAQFEQIATAMSRIEDPSKRTAIAFQLFGRGATDLLPLFANGGAFKDAEAVLGRYPAILERNTKLLDDIGDSLGAIPQKMRGLFAGVIDQLAPTIKELTDKINKIDLTELGQNIGSFVGVAIDAWDKGQFGQFIELTIKGAFELGLLGARRLWDAFSGDVSVKLFDALWGALSGFSQIVLMPLDYIAAALTVVVDNFRETWGLILNMFGKEMPAAAVTWDNALQSVKETWSATMDRAGITLRESIGLQGSLVGQTEAEKTALERIIGLMKQRQALVDASRVQEEHRMNIPGVRDRKQGEKERLDPEDINLAHTGKLAIRDISTELGTLAYKIAHSFKTVIGSAISGLSEGIQGLIKGTMTWGTALAHIGTSILNGVINAIAQMFAEWIVQMTLVRALKAVFQAEDKVQAGLTALAWAPAAGTVNAATGGTTASIGVPLTLALILAAVGTIAALAFESGGYTGDGPPGQIAGVVHKGELVLPADVTAMLTPTQRASMVAGDFSSAPSSGRGRSIDRQTRVVVVDDHRSADDLANDPAFETLVVRIANRNRWRGA